MARMLYGVSSFQDQIEPLQELQRQYQETLQGPHRVMRGSDNPLT